MRFYLLPLILLGCALLAIWWFFAGDDAAEQQAKGTPVEAIRLYKDTIYDSVESLGTTRANESIDITANVSEVITEIAFSDGDAVKEGDLIVRLSQNEEQAQLAAAQARQRENQRELKRLKTLLKNRAAAQREYDERLTQIEITKREIEEIEARIADRTLRAAFDGVLGVRRVSIGALVQPGEVITTLDDISRMKLDFTVPAVYMDSLRVGVPTEARRDGISDELFRGEIYSVNSRIDPITRSVLVRAILPNDSGLLKPGLLMRVNLLRNERKALVLPEESVFQREDDHYVLVVPEGGGEAEQRKILTGMRRPGMIEVLSGLQEGEYVITRGINRVTDGQQVQINKVWNRIRPPITAEEPPMPEPSTPAAIPPAPVSELPDAPEASTKIGK